jgi:hypothetical protein
MLLGVCSLSQFFSVNSQALHDVLSTYFEEKGKKDEAQAVCVWLDEQLASLKVGNTTLEAIHQQINIKFNLSLELDQFKTMYESVLTITEAQIAALSSFVPMLKDHPIMQLLFTAVISESHYDLLMKKLNQAIPEFTALLGTQVFLAQSNKLHSINEQELLANTVPSQVMHPIKIRSFTEAVREFAHPGFVFTPINGRSVDVDINDTLVELALEMEALQKNSVMLPFSSDDIAQQHGCTCKLTAIASLDRFFAHKNQYPAIPVFKNSKGVYGPERSAISLRLLSKQIGSLQGELLEINQLTTLLNQSLGYKSEIVELGREEDFRARVIRELKQGQPCIAFFSVDDGTEKTHGQPIVSDKESIEHACLITGYDGIKDTLRITHWGKHFEVPLKLFYQSNLALFDTRHQEHYRSTKAISDILLGYQASYAIQRKFNLTDRASLMIFASFLQRETGADPELVLDLAETIPAVDTLVPKAGSGFRNKMICIEAPTPADVAEMQVSNIRLNSFA